MQKSHLDMHFQRIEASFLQPQLGPRIDVNLQANLDTQSR